MILVVLTTDGDGREDGNVWYSRYLAIGVEPVLRNTVMDLVATILNTRRKDFGDPAASVSIPYSQWITLDDDGLSKTLTGMGFPTIVVKGDQMFHLVGD